jgi:hypothetical protein
MLLLVVIIIIRLWSYKKVGHEIDIIGPGLIPRDGLICQFLR